MLYRINLLCHVAWSLEITYRIPRNDVCSVPVSSGDNRNVAKEEVDTFLQRNADVSDGPLAVYKQYRIMGLYRKDARQESTIEKV